MKTARPGYVIVKRDYSRMRVFHHLSDRYCTYCGGKGVYEPGDDWGDSVYCFHCEAQQPYDIYDPDRTLPALKRGDAEVVDFKEDIKYEEISELSYKFELDINNALRRFEVVALPRICMSRSRR